MAFLYHILSTVFFFHSFFVPILDVWWILDLSDIDLFSILKKLGPSNKSKKNEFKSIREGVRTLSVVQSELLLASWKLGWMVD